MISKRFFFFSNSFENKVKVLASQSCPTLWDPMDCSLPGSQSLEFSRQEYWSGLPFPSPVYPPDPGIEPRSLELQADSLPSEPLGKLFNDMQFFYLEPYFKFTVKNSECSL